MPDDQAARTARFIRLMKNPFRFRVFLLTRLPSAFFSGLRLRHLDEETCEISVPYKWFTKNPFRSTYFACLSMAAEMTTGALAQAQVFGHQPPISMLVIKTEAEFFKKAVGQTRFICADGKAMREVVNQAINTGESQLFRARSTGISPEGQPVAEFFVTWSFKRKSSAAT